MENLWQFLRMYNYNDTHFFGRRFIALEDNTTFYSGGPGTVMSRNTLRILGKLYAYIIYILGKLYTYIIYILGELHICVYKGS